MRRSGVRSLVAAPNPCLPILVRTGAQSVARGCANRHSGRTKARTPFGWRHLFLQLAPIGAKCWVLVVQVKGRRYTVGLGGHRFVSLAEAREAAFENRKAARCGIVPVTRTGGKATAPGTTHMFALTRTARLLRSRSSRNPWTGRRRVRQETSLSRRHAPRPRRSQATMSTKRLRSLCRQGLPRTTRSAGTEYDRTSIKQVTPVEYQADRIRQFVVERYVRPFLSGCAKQLTIRAGNVAKDMGLEGRIPNICSVLRGEKLLTDAKLELVGCEGPPSGQSTTMTYIYEAKRGTPSAPQLVAESEGAWLGS